MKLFSLIAAIVATTIIVPILRAQTGQRSHSSYSSHTPTRKYNFAVVTRDGIVSTWGDFSWTKFDSLRDRTKEDTIYVRKDGDLYAITDRGLVGQAKTALEPMERLGRQQGELGRQQGALGRKQGELGRQQGELGRQMGKDAQSGRTMGELGSKMGELGRQQGELGRQQGELGKKQGELGRQQAEAAKEADEKITRLIDDAFARGMAKKS